MAYNWHIDVSRWFTFGRHRCGWILFSFHAFVHPSDHPWDWVWVLRTNCLEEMVYILACWCIQMASFQFIDAYWYYCPSVRSSGHLGLGLGSGRAKGGGCCHHWGYGGYLLPLLAAHSSFDIVLIIVIIVIMVVVVLLLLLLPLTVPVPVPRPPSPVTHHG